MSTTTSRTPARAWKALDTAVPPADWTPPSRMVKSKAHPPAPWRAITGAFPSIPKEMPATEKQRQAAWVVERIGVALETAKLPHRSVLYRLRKKWAHRASGKDRGFNARGTTPGPRAQHQKETTS